MPFKQKVIAECKRVLDEKREVIRGSMNEINDSMDTETKSTVGDKHETARAKMQAEFERLRTQLTVLNEQARELERIHAEPTDAIFQGSVIETNNGIFFMAIALGKIVVGNTEVKVISAQSPIGQVMVGLRAHATFTVNGINYTIQRFY